MKRKTYKKTQNNKNVKISVLLFFIRLFFWANLDLLWITWIKIKIFQTCISFDRLLHFWKITSICQTIWMVFFPGQWQTKNRRRRKHTVILVRHHHSAKEDAGRKQQMELHTSEGPVRTSRPVNCVKKFSYRNITEVNVQNQNPFGPKLQTFVSPETPMTEDAGQHHSAEPLQYSTPWKRAADESTPMQFHCTAPICRFSPRARALCPLQLQGSHKRWMKLQETSGFIVHFSIISTRFVLFLRQRN